ncbi:MAG: hypothetical protein LBC29_05235 [Propionibacteriaceae bacterium]|jgi:hypothetical protein|nr:hypothetical protein [Propionibacteriaceae bacterium]
MTVRFDDMGIVDPALEFSGGVAAIDMFTLNKAGWGIAELGFDIQLPEASDVALPGIFDALCVVEVSSGPTVTATIDTQKMRWGANTDAINRSSFTDYTGVERYGVKFSRQAVSLFGELGLTAIPTKLADESNLLLWFAEIPETTLQTLGYYALYAYAAELTEKATQGAQDSVLYTDWISVPASQIRWKRSMDEILQVNRPQVKAVEQRVYLALDETGVRVKAVTRIVRSSFRLHPKPPKTYTFGAKHPVLMWLTAPDSTLPFAVIATKSEAWLNPDAAVSFDDAAFSEATR